MAQDATGTPTALGIPKFNTAVDAASGKGGNAQMDSIDVLLAARIIKPSGIISGEVPVYDGANFVRSSATLIGAASLGTGTPDATKFLRGDGSWQPVSVGPTWTYSLISAPPGTPANGDIWIAVDSTTNPTYQWMFRYNTSEATYKWEFIGGAPVVVEVLTLETTASTTYVDLATVGPSFTIPRAGDWIYTSTVEAQSTTGGGTLAAVKLGAAATSDTDAAQSGGNAVSFTPSMTRKISAVAASDVWKTQYRAITGTGSWLRRRLAVVPVRVS